MTALTSLLTQVVGPRYVLTEPAETARYTRDWTGAVQGRAAAVVRPADTAEVAAVVQVCRDSGAGVVPQGGNTGLVAGGIPHDGEVVLSLERLSHAPQVDPLTGWAAVPAGATVEALQRVALSSRWMYGVDLASRGSATLGGTIATNAGGLRALRYGDTRAQLIGVEVVTGDGRIVSHMHGLVRDNAGYHLPSLMAGSEGTLGVVTAAQVRLHPRPAGRAVALLGFASVATAVQASRLVRQTTADVEALELFTGDGMRLVSQVTGTRPPFEVPEACLLVEVAGRRAEDDLVEMVDALDDVTQGAFAEDAPSRRRLWTWREALTESISTLGPPLKLDVTIPLVVFSEFVATARRLVRASAAGATPWFFGHVGQGNLHLNISSPGDRREHLTDALLTEVARVGGSISSEHGIGRAKRAWLELSRSADEVAVMQSVKRALDPDHVLNPGVLLPEPGR